MLGYLGINDFNPTFWQFGRGLIRSKIFIIAITLLYDLYHDAFFVITTRNKSTKLSILRLFRFVSFFLVANHDQCLFTISNCISGSRSGGGWWFVFVFVFTVRMIAEHTHLVVRVSILVLSFFSFFFSGGISITCHVTSRHVTLRHIMSRHSISKNKVVVRSMNGWT